MNAVVAEDRQLLHARLVRAREAVTALERKRDRFDAELEAMAERRQQYALLDSVRTALDKLEEMGAAALFWGAESDAGRQATHLERIREVVQRFGEEVARIEQGRDRLNEQIHQHLHAADLIDDELLEIEEEEELRRHEFVIERECAETPYRPMVMPWTGTREDERRFRKVLSLMLLLTLITASLMSLWRLTPRDRAEVAEIPEHLVRLVKKEPPRPAPRLEERKPEPKEDAKKPEKDNVKTPAEKPVEAPKKESPGLLAFKNAFSDLMELPAEQKLGSDARVTNEGHKSTGQQAERAILTRQGQSGSGGINTAGLSRNVGGLGKQVSGVQFARVESAIGADMKEADRPLSKGPGPSRTDEEIQIVFDRYKAALYRIYNRELRNDPTLSGKMVLRITIEPDGEVSFAKVESTDLDSPTLAAEIVERVKKFNFGAKEGVPPVTILYPIDFLPAADGGAPGNS